MWVILCDRMREDVTGSWCCFETPCAPTTVEIKPLDGRLCEKGARVRANIDDSTPTPHHPYTAEDWKQLGQRSHLMFDHVEGAALCVGIIKIRAGADDELSFVRLAEIDVNRV